MDYNISKLPKSVGKSERYFLYVLKDNGATHTPLDASITDLCDLVNTSRNTVIRVIKFLEDEGYIQVRTGKGRSNNNYMILPDNFQ